VRPMVDFGKLDSFIFEKMAKTHLPGLSLAVVMGGEVVHSRGFGFRDLEHGLMATPGPSTRSAPSRSRSRR